MGRPKNKKASDGSYYKALLVLEDRKDIFGQVVGIVSCPEEEGCFIVKEWSNDELSCPLCTGGKFCFKSAPILGYSEIKEVAQNEKIIFFRLVAKACPKEQRVYLFQHLCRQEEQTSLGDLSFLPKGWRDQSFMRFIPEAQFRNKCVFCPSKRISQKGVRGFESNITRVECAGCHSFFYVLKNCYLSKIRIGHFKDACTSCGVSYLEVNTNAIPGIFCVRCRACKLCHVILPDDEDSIEQGAFDAHYIQAWMNLSKEEQKTLKEELRKEAPLELDDL